MLRPAAVGLGGIDLALPRLTHPPCGHESLHPFDIGLRPRALGLARAEPLDARHLVVPACQAVNPAEAQRDLDRLGIGQGHVTRTLVEQSQPHLGHRVVIDLQPLLPLLRRTDVEDEPLSHRAGCSAAFSAASPRLVASAAAGEASARLAYPCTMVGSLLSSTGTPAA